MSILRQYAGTDNARNGRRCFIVRLNLSMLYKLHFNNSFCLLRPINKTLLNIELVVIDIGMNNENLPIKP